MSNPILTHKRIRIRFNSDQFTSQQDILISATPKMYRGNDARFDVIVYWNSLIADLSNLASLTLGIYGTNRQTSKASKTVAAAAITAIPSAAGWTDGSEQHAAFEFTGTEMNWALAAGLVEENFFLVLSGITTDVPGHDITYGTSALTLVEDGAGNAAIPPTNDPLYYTQPEADARFVQRHADGASWMLKDGQHPYRYVPATGLWHPEIITTIDGQHVITLGQEGIASP